MRNLFLIVLLLGFVGCAEIIPEPYVPSSGHLGADQPLPDTSNIPDLVQQAPVLPAPEPPAELEKYTVVVNEVPVNELLFALARDAEINVDIDPTIDGIVTINAVDQTLPQLLERITRQVNLRYEYLDDTLLIQPDTPFFRTYKIDYLNVSRGTSATIAHRIRPQQPRAHAGSAQPPSTEAGSALSTDRDRGARYRD